MPKIIWEWCSHCNMEVKIPDNQVSDCPLCGNEILPCSECDEPGRNCDWTRENRCHKYPREEKRNHENRR